MSRIIPSFLYGYEWDNAFDNCLTEDKYYTFGSYIDLCGMSAEDALNWANRIPVVNPSGDTSGSTSGDTSGDTETTANTLYISFEDVSGRFQMNISPEYQTESSVEMTVILNEDKFVVDIDSGGVVSEGGGVYKVTVPAKTKGKYNVGIYATPNDSSYAAGDILISKESTIDPTLKYDDKKYEYSTKIVPDGFFVTFVLDGSEYEKKSYAFGETIVAPEVTAETGYTFSGWDDEIPATMPAQNITINGHTTPNTYHIKYYVDGTLVHTDSFAYKSTVTEYTYTPATGYIFNGWSTEIPTTMPYNDVEIQGTTTAKVYTVKYVVDGVERDDLTQTYSYGDTIVLPTIDEQEGYRIVWGEHPTTVPDVDVTTITVNHVINQYILTLTVDGKPYTSITQDYGTAISVTDPTKEGYSFEWDEEIPATMPAENKTINGTFTVNSYTLEFTVDGNFVSSGSVEYGATIVYPTVEEHEGHTFSWDSSAVTMPANNLTINGTYTVNSYTLTFVVSGETVSSDSVEYGATIVYPTVQEVEGYTFSWDNEPVTMPAANTTITGVYTVNSYTLTFIVSGETVSSGSVEYGATIVYPTIEEHEGYTFSWSSSAVTMPANDLTINGIYTINSYTLTFIVSGETVSSGSVEYGTTIVYPTVQEVEGHTFSWDSSAVTMPANDLTINGVYTINQYTLTLTVNGGPYSSVTEYTSITQDYGTAISVTNPSEVGYSFEWDTAIPATMPSSNTTVNGTFTINSYTLTFVISGETVSSGSVEYNSVITYPQHQDIEGYDFAWDSNITNMPAADTTITGNYTVQSFILTFTVDNVFLSSGSVEYGTTIVYPTVGEREGYVFSWDNEPVTMPAQDLTINGTYTEIKNKVYYGCLFNSDIDNLSDYTTLDSVEVETGNTYDLTMFSPEPTPEPDDDAPDAEWEQWEEDNYYGYVIAIPSTFTTYSILEDGAEVSSNTNPRKYVVAETGVMIDGTECFVIKNKMSFASVGITDKSKKLVL